MSFAYTNVQYTEMQKHRKSGYSNIDEAKEPIEAIPIIPGFYLQNPKGLSKSLFENPKAWTDDVLGILSSEDTKTRYNKTRISAKAVNKSPSEDYFKGEILKAVKNLNKYRENQKYKKDLSKKSKAHIAPQEPVKKPAGRIFKGIKDGIVYRGKGKNKKPRNDYKNKKKIGKLLKSLLFGNINNKKYRGREKYDYKDDETEEQSKKTGDMLGSILNAYQSNDQKSESEINQRPAMLIISSASLQDKGYEDENNAKESIEVSDEDSSDSLNLHHTRRNDKPDKPDIPGSQEDPLSETSASSSTDYERNPGNPYTVHKNKYKQNWPYNHFMDGDHMNINPLGPQFGTLGPTGPELFFGRKWWYYNQDDYKPMS